MQSIRFGFPLLIIDLVVVTCILFAVIGALSLAGNVFSLERFWSLMGIQAIVVASCLAGLRLYRNVGMHPVVELERVVTATALAYLTLILISIVGNDRDLFAAVLCLVSSGCLSALILPSVRHLARCFLGKTPWWGQPVVIFGCSNNSDELIDELNKECHLGWKPIGYVAEFQQHWERENATRYCLGDEADLPNIIEQHNVFWGMIESEQASSIELQQLMDRYHPALPNIVSVNGRKGNTSLFSRGIDCGSLSGVCYSTGLSLFIPKMIKRAFDLVVSSFVMICLSPLFLVLAIAVRRSSPGPIFYSHERLGSNGEPFRIWKFRSMVQNGDQILKTCLAKDPKLRAEWQKNEKLAHDPRVTRVGRLLRKTSLDELPQLWNVLNGSMSLVGPRPVPLKEIEKYGDVIWLYTRTKPGITGLWQVSGRNRTTYEERLQYVSFYSRNWSLWLDWYILLKTIRVVILCEGAC